MIEAPAPAAPHAGRRPLRLQTRLMAAVTGIVSLILVVVAAVTSIMLSASLEERLDQQLRSAAIEVTALSNAAAIAADRTGTPPTAALVLSGRTVPSGLVLAIAPARTGASGAVVQPTGGAFGEIQYLTRAQLRALAGGANVGQASTVSLDGYGSYRVTASDTMLGTIVVGLPRSENLRTLGALFTTIALATIGGLVLLALTTAITIRMSLRPLREVARIASRVAGQPLAVGAVSITERVPHEHADPRTETGEVGAALNVLLDHVDTALASRQHKEEQMRRFVADASHELRTPLASIRGYSELSLKAMNTASDPESTRTALERIQAQSLRMTRLVEDLLLLARLDEGRELVYGTIDLGRLGLEAVTDAQPTGPDHHWEIDVPDEPVMVVGDAGRLNQVITNLLANARTHTPEGTTVSLSVTAESDAGVLRIHDDGPGIDPALQTELFSRFARGDRSRARQTGGTGLGLAIVKAIVDGHRGTIAVASTPGSTTFTVRIPTTPPRPALPATTPIPQ